MDDWKGRAWHEADEQPLEGARTVMDIDNQAVQRLLDEAEIRRLLARYSQAVDRGDMETLRGLYHHDATDDHSGVYSGGIDGFIATLQGSLDRGMVTCTRHCISTIAIEIDGEVAVVESYFDAYHRRQVESGTVDELAAGRYLDRMERRDGTWRIAHRRVVWDHMKSGPGDPYPWESRSDDYVVGIRSTQDESVAWFRDRGPQP
jgi:ketosteroid isomerase-like protein